MLDACAAERLLASPNKEVICTTVLSKSVFPFLLNKDKRPKKDMTLMINMTTRSSTRVVPLFPLSAAAAAV